MSVGFTRPAHVPADRVIDLDVYNPPGLEQGYHEAWKRLQDSVPAVVWTPRNGGHWVVTRGAEIAEVYADYERFSSRVLLAPKFSSEGRCPRHIVPSYVDPPEHRHYRNLLNSSFSPKVIAGLEPVIRGLAADLVDAVAGKGACDFTADYAEILPIQIFMSMVDLPLSDVPMIRGWVQRVTQLDSNMSLEEAKAFLEEGHRNIHDYMAPYIDARLGRDGQDMLSRIINGRIEGRALTRQEMTDMCTQVMFGGLDTVVNFLGFVMDFLARNPGHRRALAADPALIPSAVDEFLRRFPVVVIGRDVTRDTTLGGMPLKAGEMVMMVTPLAGLDDRLNDRPMEVDFHRSSMQHATFGAGPHVCAGAVLARTEVRVTLEEWLKRIPDFELQPGRAATFRGGTVGGVVSLPLRWDVG